MYKHDPIKHHRRSIRLKGFDYSNEGLYFITICVRNHACLFGHIKTGQMILNPAGQMVEREWRKLPDRFPDIALHEFVVMPNHFHGILEIIVGATLVAAPSPTQCDIIEQPYDGQPRDGEPKGLSITSKSKTLGDIIGAFQSIITVEYIRGVKNAGWPPFDGKLLQRNYWEHIIRNEQAFYNISNYIRNNPAKWMEDKFFTA